MEQLKASVGNCVGKFSTMSKDEWLNFIKDNKWAIGGAVAVGVLSYKLLAPRKCRKTPPGPKGWPVLGDVNIFKYTDFSEYVNLIKGKYGDVLYITGAFGFEMVVLASHRAIKQAFLAQGSQFIHRPHSNFSSIVDFEEEITMAPVNEKWRENKKFASSALRHASTKNGSSEDKILAELRVLFEEFRKSDRKEIELDQVLDKCTANIICRILFNEQYEFDDQTLTGLIDDVRNLFKTFETLGNYVEFLPSWMFTMFFDVKGMQTEMGKLQSFVAQRVEEHKSTFDPNNLRDYTDMYIQRNMGQENVNWTKTVNTIIAAFPDAINTAATSMAWIIFFLAWYPDIQQRLQEEINGVSGQSQEIFLSNRKDTPLTHAFYLESLRLGIPFGGTALHCSKEDEEVLGHNIPAGVPVFAMLQTAMHDPDVFPDPMTFKLERFLSPDGTVINADLCIPFGLGPRMCLGEALIKSEQYLLTANFVKNFTVSFPEDQPKPPLDAIYGIPRKPSSHKVIIKSR